MKEGAAWWGAASGRMSNDPAIPRGHFLSKTEKAFVYIDPEGGLAGKGLEGSGKNVGSPKGKRVG